MPDRYTHSDTDSDTARSHGATPHGASGASGRALGPGPAPAGREEGLAALQGVARGILGGQSPDRFMAAIDAAHGAVGNRQVLHQVAHLHGLAGVRVHENSPAPARFAALAYTRGTDIYLGPGQGGLLAHELGHVVQQQRGQVRPTGTVAGAPVNEDPGLEHRAAALGEQALGQAAAGAVPALAAPAVPATGGAGVMQFVRRKRKPRRLRVGEEEEKEVEDKEEEAAGPRKKKPKLQQDEEEAGASKKKQYICNWPQEGEEGEECNKAFKYLSHLKRHQLIHTGETPFVCDLDGCSKAFKREDHLTRHKRDHTEEKLHVCKVCNTAFKRQEDLRVHIYSHFDEKQFKCKVKGCNKAFKTPSNLRQHVHRVHSGKKQHICQLQKKGGEEGEECGMAFATKPELKKHKLIHTGDKPYKCKVCGRGFAQSGNLTAHLWDRHKLLPYTCPECDEFFHLKRDLKAHQSKLHWNKAALKRLRIQIQAEEFPPSSGHVSATSDSRIDTGGDTEQMDGSPPTTGPTLPGETEPTDSGMMVDDQAPPVHRSGRTLRPRPQPQPPSVPAPRARARTKQACDPDNPTLLLSQHTAQRLQRITTRYTTPQPMSAAPSPHPAFVAERYHLLDSIKARPVPTDREQKRARTIDIDALEWGIMAALYARYQDAWAFYTDVKPSTLPRAGQGLFALRPIPAGTLIGPYTGVRLSDRAAKRMERDPAVALSRTAYITQVTNARGKRVSIIDGWPGYLGEPDRQWGEHDTRPCQGSRINACVRAGDRYAPELTNVTFNGQIVAGQGYTFVRASRDIQADEELIVNYGPAYSKRLCGLLDARYPGWGH